MNSQEATLEKRSHYVDKLSPLEVDVIDIFVRIARLFGVSKSVGEIYGLLFISTAPVPLDYIRVKLNLSSGSASQGLRLLRTLGAVHATYVPGDRRDHFLAETALRKITSGYLREKVMPDLMLQEEQVQRLGNLLGDLPAGAREHIEARIQLLQAWRLQARAVLPIVMGGLETGV
jgi:HTH-type transcriptional regulator, glycine betaine synthesis regulator